MTSRLRCACDTHRRGFLGGLVAWGFSGAELRAIGRDNATRLMPRWNA